MKRIFKTRHFNRWMRKTELTDALLCLAVDEMAQGLIDADLGSNVYKKRIGIAGRGKSGGVRTLVATHRGAEWFFVFGFEKSNRANVDSKELLALQAFASDLLALTSAALERALLDAALKEICHDH